VGKPEIRGGGILCGRGWRLPGDARAQVEVGLELAEEVPVGDRLRHINPGGRSARGRDWRHRCTCRALFRCPLRIAFLLSLTVGSMSAVGRFLPLTAPRALRPPRVRRRPSAASSGRSQQAQTATGAVP